MSYNTIRYEVEDGVALITLSRPDKLNAFTPVMMHEMIDALDRTDADDAVRAVIFTGEGRAYCAGADLSAGTRGFVDEGQQSLMNADGSVNYGAEAARDGGGLLTLRLFESTKPLIGAINGAAVGVGVTMTLPMDIRLASEKARFGFVFTRRGIVPEAASSWFLPRVVGVSKALEWCYSGRVLDAQEALDGGLVRSLHAPEDLLPAARAIAREIVENTSPVSVALPDAVARPGPKPPDGGPPHRQPRHPVTHGQRRRRRGRGLLPREARSHLSRRGVERHAGLLSVVGRRALSLKGRSRRGFRSDQRAVATA